jgi:phage terminase Nu1 subunit (DNA packaging protein)
MKEKQTDPNNFGVWNTTQVSQMLGISTQIVNEHARSGVIPKMGRGKFDPVKAVSSYCKWCRTQRDEATGSGKSLTAARTELAQEDTRLKRLQAEKLEGRLCDVDLVLEAENKLLSGISNIIRNSDLDESRKEDIFTSIRDHGDKWKEEMTE